MTNVGDTGGASASPVGASESFVKAVREMWDADKALEIAERKLVQANDRASVARAAYRRELEKYHDEARRVAHG